MPFRPGHSVLPAEIFELNFRFIIFMVFPNAFKACLDCDGLQLPCIVAHQYAPSQPLTWALGLGPSTKAASLMYTSFAHDLFFPIAFAHFHALHVLFILLAMLPLSLICV